MSEPIDMTEDFCQWMEEQSKERLIVALERAQRRDTEFWNDESFNEVLTDELKRMYVADSLSSLMAKGVIEGVVHDDGEVGYTVAEGVEL